MQLCRPAINKSPRRSSIAGMTLIEVMISAMIGAIVFAALFYALNKGQMLIQVDRENLRATEIMNGKIEQLRLLNWGSYNATNPIPTQLFSSTYVPSSFTDTFYPASVGGGAHGISYLGYIDVHTNNIVFRTPTLSTNGTPTGTTTVGTPSYATNSFASVTVWIYWSEVHYGRTNSYWRTNTTLISAWGIQNYLATQ